MGLSSLETTCSRRGFRCDQPQMRSRLEEVGATFLNGYHAALECGTSPHLSAELESQNPELRGFAFEGAAMGLALLDCFTPWPTTRVGDFLRGAGERHTYMVHVGVGWLWARLPFGLRPARRQLSPLLQWLAFDGWGFHEGFFHWQRYLAGQSPPECLAGYERRAFTQGMGRSWW
jgi:hypothetical protein